MEIYVFDNCIILHDTTVDENPVGLSEKKNGKAISFIN